MVECSGWAGAGVFGDDGVELGGAGAVEDDAVAAEVQALIREATLIRR